MRKTIQITVLLAFFFVLWFPPTAESVNKRGVANQSDQLISEAQFRKTFYQYLCRHLGKQESDVILSRVKIHGNRPVPPGKVSFKLFQNDQKTLKGYVRVVGIICVDGVARNEVKLSGWVDIFGPVVCTCRHLKKGEILKEDDVYLARKNISHLPSNILTDMRKVIGLMAKHHLKADTCLKKWMLERPPIVNKGDIVTILAESSGLKVTVPGRVLEKGYPGEFIKVQNAMSQRAIFARVVSSQTVTVDF